MKQDAFKPQGKQLTVVQGVQPPGAELGQHVRAQGQPQAMQPAPMSVKPGGDNRFIAASAPVQMGNAQPQAVAPVPQAAPPVPSSPQARRQFTPAPPEQSVGQQLGAQQRSVQQQQNAAPQMEGMETFAVYIDGTAPDGTPLTTDPFLAQFPTGSTLSGMRYERVR